jgi:predicted amidophosphoribosyltransferase
LIGAGSMSFGLLVVLFTVLLLLWMRETKSEAAGSGQRMCPSCGLITSRSKARCMECGKPLTVVYSISKK